MRGHSSKERTTNVGQLVDLALQAFLLTPVFELELPSVAGTLGELAEVVVAVPRASEAEAHALLAGVHPLASAGLGRVGLPGTVQRKLRFSRQPKDVFECCKNALK